MRQESGYFKRILAFGILVCACLAHAAEPDRIGIVIMHGKGGSPLKLVKPLADGLVAKGYRVANLEMPWSGRRQYDVGVAAAENEVRAALNDLRAQGAKWLFVAGHSQGGAFTAYLAGQLDLDGAIAITPGGSSASTTARDKLGGYLQQARALIAAGRGNETALFGDYEGSRGAFAVTTTAANYAEWFDPDGAMDLDRSAVGIKPETPMLWIVAKADYPGLRANNLPLFRQLPRNPLTRLYEPTSDHTGAPAASLDAIVSWIDEVAAAGPKEP